MLVLQQDTTRAINVMTKEHNAFPGINPETGKLRDHGTSVAGVIAMVKDNEKCGVGIAYHSTITGMLNIIS